MKLVYLMNVYRINETNEGIKLITALLINVKRLFVCL